MKNLKNKKVLVYGLSVSGIWASKLLQKKKANVFLFDDNKEKLSSINLKNCCVLQNVNKEILKQMDFVVVSPSIEKDNVIILLSEELGIKIYSEVELASLFDKNIIAITGTNGKTTTVELITAILNTTKKAIACGNIGYPLSKAVLNNKRHVKVCEVSSFMLEHCDEFKPHIVSVLNIQEDHLIRHKTFEEYANLKKSIYKNLTFSDFAVVNKDLDFKPSKNSNIVTYSYLHNADVCYREGVIYQNNEKVVSVNELKIKGKHNIYNVMCAICVASILKIKTDKIRSALISFKPDRFRNEQVGTINGIKFVNDSKSTNIASTLASVEANKGAIILILCGSNKNLDYSLLFNKLSKRVKEIFVFGEVKEQIKQANQEKFKICDVNTLNEAVDLAVKQAKPNDTILFSPSSASYDQFENYIERGNMFNKKVKEYELTNAQK